MAFAKVNQIANAQDLAVTTRYKFKADSHRVLSAQATWTISTGVAAVKLQYSNDPRVDSDPNNAVWEDYAASTAITATGSKAWGDVGSTIDALYWSILYTWTSGDSDTFRANICHVSRT